MAFENITLSQLMEEARKHRETPPEDTSDEDIFYSHDYGDDDFDDFDDPDDYGEEDDIFDLDERIDCTLSRLEPYHLSEEDRQTVREFLTFRLQTARAPFSHPEARRGYYNLLIHGDEEESIRHVSEILCAALDILPGQALIHTEAELLLKLANPPRDKRPLIPDSTTFILIDACQDTPRMNLDGGSAVRDASRKAMETYRTLWDTVFSHVLQHPGTVLIVGCGEDVYRSTLRPFSQLSQRICSHHIRLAPRTGEELLADCLTELGKSTFSLAADFEPALKEYFSGAYPTSALRSQDFVSDLISRIYTRYYSRKRDSRVLTADCVPPLDTLSLSVESVLGQLDQLVGLEGVKAEFRNIYTMQIAGLTNRDNHCYHMLFSGNPGTGKTTVARMAADLFHRMGILKTNKLVSVKPCDLISEWIGGTGMKAMEVIRRAYNGILFIDEAYGIATMDRGEELLNVLVQEMENHSDKLIVILAGYTDEMRELLKANPGLGSRIGQEIHFDDYSQDQLAQIFLQMCKKDGFTLDGSARDELDDCIGALMTREFFGNARDIRNMLQDLKEAWSEDFYAAVKANGADSAELEKFFLPHHFEKIMPPKKEVSIHDLIGLDVLKGKLEQFKRQALYQKYLREKGFTNLSDFSMHMIFTGNPGTGKSTVARLIADDLYSIGMLKTNRLVIAERKDLVSVHGDTGRKTADVIRKAVGGVLFVDEAYALAGNRYGNNECIEVLLTAMEEHKSDTVFIFAGYVEEMQEFLLSNPGIQSRIGYTFHFGDYAPEELTRMYAGKMKKMGFVVSDGALTRVREIMEYFQDVKHFGNGRFVNHLIHQTISQRANRDFTKQYRNIHSQDIPSIKTLIETAPNGMHLYDPAAITPEQRRRTAVHELGHAIVMVGLDPNNLPESISIRSHAGSYGRVKLSGNPVERTEQQLFHHIATLLGGKNAESLIFGCHGTGCSNDYARAKQVATDMVERFAMTSHGTAPKEILSAADKLSADTLLRFQDRIDTATSALLEAKTLTGKEFAELLNEEAATGK